MSGPFVVWYTQASDPLIRPANNSTISVNYGSWGSGSTPQPADFAFSIPASLQGKTGWILIQPKKCVRLRREIAKPSLFRSA